MDFTSPVVGEAATEQAAHNLANTVFAPQRLLGATWCDACRDWLGGSCCGTNIFCIAGEQMDVFQMRRIFFGSYTSGILCFGGSCEPALSFSVFSLSLFWDIRQWSCLDSLAFQKNTLFLWEHVQQILVFFILGFPLQIFYRPVTTVPGLNACAWAGRRRS